jgi:hypothetical protein
VRARSFYVAAIVVLPQFMSRTAACSVRDLLFLKRFEAMRPATDVGAPFVGLPK